MRLPISRRDCKLSCHDHHHRKSRSKLLDSVQSNFMSAPASRHNAIYQSTFQHAPCISPTHPIFIFAERHKDDAIPHVNETIDNWIDAFVSKHCHVRTVTSLRNMFGVLPPRFATPRPLHIPRGPRFGTIKFIFIHIFIVCGEDCRLLRGCLYADWEELRVRRSGST